MNKKKEVNFFDKSVIGFYDLKSHNYVCRSQ